MKNLGSARKLAKLVGCSNTAISKLVKDQDSRIVMAGKMIDLDESIKRLNRSNFGAKSKQHNVKKKLRNESEVDPAIKEEVKAVAMSDKAEGFENLTPPGEPRTSLSYEELEIIKMYEQARKLHIANNVEEGKYILAAAAESKAFDVARKARDILQSLAPRIRAIVPNDQKHEIEQMVIREVDAALNQLADWCDNAS